MLRVANMRNILLKNGFDDTCAASKDLASDNELLALIVTPCAFAAYTSTVYK